MFSNFGVAEIAIITFLIILFFGSKKIPEFIKGLGESIKEFRKGVKDEKK